MQTVHKQFRDTVTLKNRHPFLDDGFVMVSFNYKNLLFPSISFSLRLILRISFPVFQPLHSVLRVSHQTGHHLIRLNGRVVQVMHQATRRVSAAGELGIGLAFIEILCKAGQGLSVVVETNQIGRAHV